MALIQQKFQNIGTGDLSSTASRPHNTSQSVSVDFENPIFTHLLKSISTFAFEHFLDIESNEAIKK